MVGQVRCPYCGHPEVPVSAKTCPVCGGETKTRLAESVRDDVTPLGSLSQEMNDIDIEALLSKKTPEKPTELPREFVESGMPSATSAEAPEKLRMAVEIDPTDSVSQMVPNAVISSADNVTGAPSRQRANGFGNWLYLTYVGLFIAAILAVLHVRPATREVSPAPKPELTEDARLGLEALEQERYGAAIEYLERATQTRNNRYLLPSLALAYSQTGQIERSRKLIRTYRSERAEGNAEEE